MRVVDPVTHYRIDAEEFDYFETGSRADLDSTQRIRDAVLCMADMQHGDIVLDAGSGSGWLLKQRPLRSQGMTVCADLGIRSLKKIRRLYGDEAPLVVCDINRLPFREGVLDAVVASEVLEHVNEPDAAVQEMAAALKPGGRLIVSTPYKEKLLTYLCIHCNRTSTVNAHLHSIDEGLLRSAIGSAGLSGFRFMCISNKLFIKSRLSSLLRFLPFRMWKIIDRLFTLLYDKPGTIIATAGKPRRT